MRFKNAITVYTVCMQMHYLRVYNRCSKCGCRQKSLNLFTLGALRREDYSSCLVCVSVCLSVCMSVGTRYSGSTRN